METENSKSTQQNSNSNGQSVKVQINVPDMIKQGSNILPTFIAPPPPPKGNK